MADYFTHICFQISITQAEAALLSEAVDVAMTLCDEEEPESLSAEFMAAFPSRHSDDPVAGFLEIFDDEDYPWIDGDFVKVPDPQDPERILLTYGSAEGSPSLIAVLLQRCCPSSLPFRFSWSGTCSRQRPDGFVGGSLEVRQERIIPLCYPSENLSQKRLVIATRDQDEGLLFWSNSEGFGDLASATVFNETEAENYDLPIANDQPKWLELPEIPR